MRRAYSRHEVASSTFRPNVAAFRPLGECKRQIEPISIFTAFFCSPPFARFLIRDDSRTVLRWTTPYPDFGVEIINDYSLADIEADRLPQGVDTGLSATSRRKPSMRPVTPFLPTHSKMQGTRRTVPRTSPLFLRPGNRDT